MAESAGALRRWAPALALLAALLAHGWMNLACALRRPAPVMSFHEHDVVQPMHALVLRGDASAVALPIQEIRPPGQGQYGAADLLAGTVRNPVEFRQSYQDSAPAWFVLSALLPALVGISLASVRLGPLLLLGLMMVVTYDAARRIAGRPAGVASALTLSLFAATWQGTRMGVPATGNLCAAALGLWALLASDAFRRPGLAAVAGALAAWSTRWGESAGDGAETASALVLPAAVCAAVALVRVLRQRDWNSAAGLLLAAAAAWAVADRSWLSMHVGGQVLHQSGTLGHLDLTRLLTHGLDYPDALVFSLLAPAGALAVLAGIVPFTLRVRPVWKTLAVLGSVMGPWALLTLSEKAHDYYITPVLPGLAIVAGVELVSTPRFGHRLGVGFGALMAASWLWASHLDLPGVAALSCNPVVATLLGADPWLCRPERKTNAMVQWYRRWRNPSRSERPRLSLGRWLTDGPGRDALDAMEPGSALVLLEPAEGDTDVAAFLALCHRPDVWIWRVGVHPRGLAEMRLPEGYEHVYAMTFPADRSPASVAPADLPTWLATGTSLASGEEAAIWRVESGRLQGR